MPDVFVSRIYDWAYKRWEYQAANDGQRRCGLGLRTHSATEGFSAGEQRNAWKQLSRLQRAWHVRVLPVSAGLHRRYPLKDMSFRDVFVLRV